MAHKVTKIDRNDNLDDGTPRYGVTNTKDEFWDGKEHRFVTAKTVIPRTSQKVAEAA